MIIVSTSQQRVFIAQRRNNQILPLLREYFYSQPEPLVEILEPYLKGQETMAIGTEKEARSGYSAKRAGKMIDHFASSSDLSVIETEVIDYLKSALEKFDGIEE